jgi:hypothetical protein
MAKSNRATQGKRNREMNQKERQQEKETKRVTRKEQKKVRADCLEDGIDPDLVGIVPGPQSQLED